VVRIQLGNDEVHLIEEGLGCSELFIERAFLQLIFYELRDELIHQRQLLETGPLALHRFSIFVRVDLLMLSLVVVLVLCLLVLVAALVASAHGVPPLLVDEVVLF
jgi:hypothetical protein